MAELLNLRIGASICSKYSANKISKSRILFIAFLFCVFFFGNAKVYSQPFGGGSGTWGDPYRISTRQHLTELADSVNNSTVPLPNNWSTGKVFKVIQDITDTVRIMIGNDTNYFQGALDGNNKKITVGISSNNQYVGLFSQINLWNGMEINDLVIDGYVTGGLNSQYVGGLVGFAYSTLFHNVTNLSDVSGLSSFSSVGGVAGAINPGDGMEINPCINNGSVTGGFAIAGVFGTIYLSQPQYSAAVIMLHNFMNSGTIKSNDNVDISHYMAGIVAYVDINSATPWDIIVRGAVNVGQVLSRKSLYAAGVVAHLDNSGNALMANINNSSNSGLVDGATIAVGGIAGYIDNVSVIGCINTNWIEPTVTGQNSGAIVGFNNGTVRDCFYDEQMCILNNGIGTGLLTTQMLGNILQAFLPLPWNWVFQSNLYPRPSNWFQQNHPISLLSAAPIYLRDTTPPVAIPFETLDNVRTDFTVSNGIAFPPPIPPNPPNPYWHPYRWESIWLC